MGLGYPQPGIGVTPTWDWGTPHHLGLGYPLPPRTGVLPTWDWGAPWKGHGTKDWGTPSPRKDMRPLVGSIIGWRWSTPPPGGGQTENIVFRHPLDTGGKNGLQPTGEILVMLSEFYFL